MLRLCTRGRAISFNVLSKIDEFTLYKSLRSTSNLSLSMPVLHARPRFKPFQKWRSTLNIRKNQPANLLTLDNHEQYQYLSFSTTELFHNTKLQSETQGSHANHNFEVVQSLLDNLDELMKVKVLKPPPLIIENKLKSVLFYYQNFSKEEKDEFLKGISFKYCVKHDSVWNICKQLSVLEPNDTSVLKVQEKLRNALTPNYGWIFTHLSRIENGIPFLVNLRKDVLSLLTKVDSTSAEYRGLQFLNSSLRDVLSSVFSPSLLQLQRAKWKSPCSLLEKIAKYEAVHPVKSWSEIKQRTGANRRCFVYTHQGLPGEPLVILHVALTSDIEHCVSNIINSSDTSKDATVNNLIVEDPGKINAFIFYSISSTQKGLQGIDLGNYLIKRACHELHEEFPLVKKFSTLSPIPTFVKWLIEQMNSIEKGDSALQIKKWQNALSLINPENKDESWSKLKQMLTDNSWFQDVNLVDALKEPLMTACSQYLYNEKKRGYTYDSVANFHLRNGAVMWRLNWLADTSPRGLSNSCGLMVNYRYYLDTVDTNGLKYIQQKTFTASEEIIQLATGRTT